MMRIPATSSKVRTAFTLLETLVVVGILVVLAAILLPAFSKAQAAARRTACLSNLRQIGVAIRAYSLESGGAIPYGPTAPPADATNFYPITGTVTNLVSLKDGSPVGLGLMLKNHLGRSPRVLFCPDPDQDVSADAELARVGTGQAQSGYFYRHGSGGSLLAPPTTAHIRIASLGRNSQGQEIRALAMDANLLASSGLAVFGVKQRTNHRRQWANVLFVDGHASSLPNDNDRFTADIRGAIYEGFGKILQAFETADPLN